MAQRKRIGSRSGSWNPHAPKPEPEPEHRHIVPAEPGWWAVYARGKGEALPVVSWILEPAKPPAGAGLPPRPTEFIGLVPFGIGIWDEADVFHGFTTYVYSAARPTHEEVRDEVREVAERMDPDREESDEDAPFPEMWAWLDSTT